MIAGRIVGLDQLVVGDELGVNLMLMLIHIYLLQDFLMVDIEVVVMEEIDLVTNKVQFAFDGDFHFLRDQL